MDASDLPDPETRGPLISLLTQWYNGAAEPTTGHDINLPDQVAALSDLLLMISQYAIELERQRGGDGSGVLAELARLFVRFGQETELEPGDFGGFLQRKGAEPFLPDDDEP